MVVTAKKDGLNIVVGVVQVAVLELSRAISNVSKSPDPLAGS